MESRMKLNMFDDYWIDFRRNTDRRWFSPEILSIVPKGAYCSLIYDDSLKKYRMFYEVLIDYRKDGPRDLYLMESDDLINFSEPELVYHGESGVHGATVMYDALDPDPSRRYKFCGMTRMGREDENICAANVCNLEVEIAFSPDGRNWTCDHKHIANEHTSDSLNKLFYNPIFEEYTLLHRSAFVDRRISARSSKDMENWSDAHIILQPSPIYNDGYTGMQQYGMTARYFDGIFYGLVWMYKTGLYNNDYSRMYGYMEPELVYSYDGREFLHTTGKNIIERPMPPMPGCTGLSPNDICESADGKWYYILCGGANHVHATEADNARLIEKLAEHDIKGGNLIYRIRRDGFCGIESVSYGGEVITKPIELLKDDLSFNVRANVGFVRFGIMKKDGTFLPGFSYDDCIPFEFDDGLDVKPQWKEHELNEVLGQQVRVAVELNTAILHCIQGTARPHLRQSQKSFAEPWGI